MEKDDGEQRTGTLRGRRGRQNIRAKKIGLNECIYTFSNTLTHFPM